jgi:8-oxo-dGTP diphosphatase
MADYPKPSYTADVVVFAYERKTSDLWLLLIERGREPFANTFALPGGFVEPNETSRAAAVRELYEETGLPLAESFLIPVGVFDESGRDPRGWVVSSAFVTVLDFDIVNPYVGSGAGDGKESEEGTEIKEVRWFSLSGSPPEMAFDHLDVVSRAAALVLSTLGGKPIASFAQGLSYNDKKTLKGILNFEARNNETQTRQEIRKTAGSRKQKLKMGRVKPARAVDAAGRKAGRKSETADETSSPNKDCFEDDIGFDPGSNAHWQAQENG